MVARIKLTTNRLYSDLYLMLYFGYFAGGIAAQTTDHSILNPDIWVNALVSTMFLIVALFVVNLVRPSR